MIQAPSVWQQDHTHRAPIAVTIHDLHGDSLRKDKVRCELLGAVAKRLPLLGTVNAVQPDALALPVVQHGDGVTVADAHDLAGEIRGEGG